MNRYIIKIAVFFIIGTAHSLSIQGAAAPEQPLSRGDSIHEVFRGVASRQLADDLVPLMVSYDSNPWLEPTADIGYEEAIIPRPEMTSAKPDDKAKREIIRAPNNRFSVVVDTGIARVMNPNRTERAQLGKRGEKIKSAFITSSGFIITTMLKIRLKSGILTVSMKKPWTERFLG